MLNGNSKPSAADAWRVVFAYARRWQVELSIRFTKTDLAFECPRLQKREARLKFWGLASLAYAFLLSAVCGSISDPVSSHG